MTREKITYEGLQKYGLVLENIRIYDTIDSTNAEAKRQTLSGAAHGTVILANSQTEGRGRLGRSFYSPADSGIYVSFLLRPTLPMEDMVKITTAASVAVGQAIFAVTGRYPDIKWVNDLYLEGKKVCGILAETVYPPDAKPVVILGVGINCNAIFPEELQDIAGNIPMEEIPDGKNRLAAELISRIRPLEEMILTDDFWEEYRAHSMVLGKTITIVGEEDSRYLVKEIGKNGELQLIDASGNLRQLTTGEISIRLTRDESNPMNSPR